MSAKPQAQERDAALQQVQGNTLNVSSIFVGILAIDEPSKLSRFGCMDVSSNSITITGNVSIAENADVGRSLSVGDTLVVQSSLSAKEITSETMHSHGTITSSEGFTSNGTLMIGNISVVGDLVVNNTMSAQDVQVQKNLSASTAFIDELTINTRFEAMNHSSFEGAVDFHDTSHFHGSSNFTGELVSIAKLTAGKVEVENSLEVGASLFTKRVYSKDIAATGFVRAATIQSKGDIKTEGTVVASRVNAASILSEDVVVSNGIRCSTARIDGALDAAGVTAQKMNVKGNLMVNGMDVFAIIEELKKQITDLERKMDVLQSDRTVN